MTPASPHRAATTAPPIASATDIQPAPLTNASSRGVASAVAAAFANAWAILATPLNSAAATRLSREGQVLTPAGPADGY